MVPTSTTGSSRASSGLSVAVMATTTARRLDLIVVLNEPWVPSRRGETDRRRNGITVVNDDVDDGDDDSSQTI